MVGGSYSDPDEKKLTGALGNVPLEAHNVTNTSVADHSGRHWLPLQRSGEESVWSNSGNNLIDEVLMPIL